TAMPGCEDGVLGTHRRKESGGDVLELHPGVLVEEVGGVGVHARSRQPLIGQVELSTVHDLVSRIRQRRVGRHGRLLLVRAAGDRDRTKKRNTHRAAHQTTPARIKSWRWITPTICSSPFRTG